MAYIKTPEHLERIKEAQRIYYANNPGPNKDRVFSETWRKNIGLASRGRKTFLGRTHTDAARAKMSASQKKYYETHSSGYKGHTSPFKGKTRGPNLGASKAKKAYWARLKAAERKKVVAAGLAAIRKSRFYSTWCSGNNLERRVDTILQRLYPGKFKLNLAKKQIGAKIPDFIGAPPEKILIEVFGDYWHGRGHTGRTRTAEERRKVGYYAQFGYTTVVLWESELDSEYWIKAKIDLALAS